MKPNNTDDAPLKRTILSLFGVDTGAVQVVVRDLPVASLSRATLFFNSKKQLFLYIDAKARLNLGDVKRIVEKIGLKPETYCTPKNRPDYFETVALKKYNEVFPGRKIVTSDDLRFYRTLVPYSPALIQISEVKNGIIYQYDSDSSTKWRPSVKFAYRRIRTS
jgi:hypothetical protein